MLKTKRLGVLGLALGLAGVGMTTMTVSTTAQAATTTSTKYFVTANPWCYGSNPRRGHGYGATGWNSNFVGIKPPGSFYALQKIYVGGIYQSQRGSGWTTGTASVTSPAYTLPSGQSLISQVYGFRMENGVQSNTGSLTWSCT